MKFKYSLILLIVLAIAVVSEANKRLKKSKKSKLFCSRDNMRIYIGNDLCQEVKVKNVFNPSGIYKTGLFFQTNNIQGSCRGKAFLNNNEMFFPYRSMSTFRWEDPCWNCRRYFYTSITVGSQTYFLKLVLDLNCWSDSQQRDFVNAVNNNIRNNQSVIRATKKETIDSTSAYVENSDAADAAQSGKANAEAKIASLKQDIITITNSMNTNDNNRKMTDTIIAAETVNNQQIRDALERLVNQEKDLNREKETKVALKATIDQSKTSSANEEEKFKKAAEKNQSDFEGLVARLRIVAPGNNSKEKIDDVSRKFLLEDKNGVQQALDKIYV